MRLFLLVLQKYLFHHNILLCLTDIVKQALILTHHTVQQCPCVLLNNHELQYGFRYYWYPLFEKYVFDVFFRPPIFANIFYRFCF